MNNYQLQTKEDLRKFDNLMASIANTDPRLTYGEQSQERMRNTGIISIDNTPLWIENDRGKLIFSLSLSYQQDGARVQLWNHIPYSMKDNNDKFSCSASRAPASIGSDIVRKGSALAPLREAAIKGYNESLNKANSIVALIDQLTADFPNISPRYNGGRGTVVNKDRPQYEMGLSLDLPDGYGSIRVSASGTASLDIRSITHDKLRDVLAALTD